MVVRIRMFTVVLVNNVVTETGNLVPEFCQQLRAQDEDLSVASFLGGKKDGGRKVKDMVVHARVKNMLRQHFLSSIP